MTLLGFSLVCLVCFYLFCFLGGGGGCFVFLSILFFETKSHCVFLVGLELIEQDDFELTQTHRLPPSESRD